MPLEPIVQIQRDGLTSASVLTAVATAVHDLGAHVDIRREGASQHHSAHLSTGLELHVGRDQTGTA